ATRGLILRKLFSPMPFTFISSSTRLNPPLLVRYSIISSAVLRPMPRSESCCLLLARLRLIAGFAGAGTSVGGAGDCADAVEVAIMNVLQSASTRARPVRIGVLQF